MQKTNHEDCFGSVIKSARQSKSMTQYQLAERLSISTRYLKAIENSGRKPSYDLLVRIIRELDISADVVFHPEICKEGIVNNIVSFMAQVKSH